MKREAYVIATHRGKDSVTGYPVWGTCRLIAVDCRSGIDWHVTHLPTGRRIAIRGTRKEAEGLARSFLKACMRRGWDVEASDPEAIQAPYRALTDEEKRGFRLEAGLD